MEFDPATAQPISIRDHDLFGDWFLVDECSVGRIQVFYPPLTETVGQERMLCRDGLIVDV
jgi:hypothetical protein